jgi:hypothetical protein
LEILGEVTGVGDNFMIPLELRFYAISPETAGRLEGKLGGIKDLKFVSQRDVEDNDSDGN